MSQLLRGGVAAVLAAVLLLFVSGEEVHGEGTPEPGAQGSNFKLLNNGSGINQYTGSFTGEYHLFTVPGRGGLDFPIRLTYNAGIGVEQEASWVGLGFGLNLGSIERSIVYIPDDMVLYHKYAGAIHQHDGWLFDDNYSPLPQVHPDPIRDSQFTDGPDMWTVALGDFGANLSIVADSSNIFRNGSTPYGPAGRDDRAVMLSASAAWESKYQRSFGLAVRIGGVNYNPESTSTAPNNERQRHCYVSPPMGSTVQNRTYNYSGVIDLIFNDSTNGYGNNSGTCEVYVYKYTNATSSWSVSGPFVVKADSSGWKATGVSVASNDRFAILCKSRQFVFEKWQPYKIDYDVEFSDWGGYYLNPEIYSDPYQVFAQGYTPRVRSFTITDKGGKSYRFGTSDWVLATSRKWENTIEDSISVAFSSSYKLTEIHSPDYVDLDTNGRASDGDAGSWVRIVYDSAVPIEYANKPLKAHHAVFQRFGFSDYADSVWQRHYVRYPLYVETPTHKAYFFLSNRRDNLGIYGPNAESNMRPKKLDSLVLFEKTATGETRQRRIAWRYADVTTRPTNFATWQDGQTLAWHKSSYKTGGAWSGGADSTGKLTLLEVKEFAYHDGDSLPGIRFRYTTNPRYEERLTWSDRDDNADFYYPTDQNGDKSYYAPGYQEDWGYFRSSLTAKPGLDQQAWSLRTATLPDGAKDSVEWESNKYLWWENPGFEPAGAGQITFRSDYVNEGDGAERGGIRVKSRRIEGGMGTDSSYEYTYGEGIATKSQTPARKATRTGFLGNSQEVGYRSVGEHLKGDGASAQTFTQYTNGTATLGWYVHNDGQYPSPTVATEEAFWDKHESGHYFLEGIKRGLPWRSAVLNADDDTLSVTENTYAITTKASKEVNLGWAGPDLNFEDGTARSTWVRLTQSSSRQFDENGQNWVKSSWVYDYDATNGLVATETDSLGGGVARKRVTEYLHTQDANLDTLLARRNILDLVRREEVQKDGGGNVVESRTWYDYKDFGNGRVYPWHRYDIRSIGDSDSLTTTFAAYDRFGNPRLVTDPSGTKMSYLWSYSGTRKILEAPNSDTGEVAYNGFEDSLTFDGWIKQASVLSQGHVYTGRYSAAVKGATSAFGPDRFIAHSQLIPGRRYVFSAWVYPKSYVRLSVDIVSYGSAPDSSVEEDESLNSWRRMEVAFTYPANASSGIECYTVAGNDTVYFDDLRIQPVDCPMQTFVYDRSTLQLEAAFDASNTFEQRRIYDGFGRLWKTYDPDQNPLSRYEYVYSRTGNSEFDPDNPNAVREIRYRSSTAGDSSVVVTYFDGLGREVQKQVAVNSNAKIVSATKYDPAGQVAIQTKPIEKSGALGSMSYDTTFIPSGWTIGNALTTGDLHGYYDGDGPGPNCSGYPFTRLTYSTDPLRRIKETGYPDTTWKIGSTRTTRLNYLSNSSGDVSGWDSRTLSKIKTTDEGGLVSNQYVDHLGRVVQTQRDSADSDPSRVKTRFDYDIRGNRIQVIRQRTSGATDELTYQYNALGYLTHEMSPDGGGRTYKYDKSGNLRFVMDSALAAADKFIYYKYDALDRRTEEGVYTDLDSATQTLADRASFPATGGSAKFTYRYDSCQTTSGVATPNFGRGHLASWKDGSGRYHRRLAYDNRGRVSYENVKIDDSATSMSYSYDRQNNLSRFYVSTKAVLPTAYYTYDMANRLVGVGTSTASYRYDSLFYWPWGALKRQSLLATPSALGQTLDYSYNPRDWLVTINDLNSVDGSASGSGDHFALRLGYGHQFNGDIDSIQFKHSTQSESLERMTYDHLRRLSRWHPGTGADTTGDEIYQYDRAGNALYWKLGGLAVGYNHVFWPNTNQLKQIGPDSNYYYDVSGNLIQDQRRYYTQEYRNIPSHIEIPHQQEQWTKLPGLPLRRGPASGEEVVQLGV